MAAVYSHYRESVYSKEVHSRKDAVLLAQIRSGYRHLFRAYQHLIDSTTDPTCQVCSEAPHTMEHWLLDYQLFISHTYGSGNLWTSWSQPRRPYYISEAGHRTGSAYIRSLSVLWRVCLHQQQQQHQQHPHRHQHHLSSGYNYGSILIQVPIQRLFNCFKGH